MNRTSTNPAARSRANLLIGAMCLTCWQMFAVTEVVHREIWYEKGDVFISDRVELLTGGWGGQPNLNPILVEYRNGGARLTQAVEALYAREDTAVVKCTANLKDM